MVIPIRNREIYPKAEGVLRRSDVGVQGFEKKFNKTAMAFQQTYNSNVWALPHFLTRLSIID